MKSIHQNTQLSDNELKAVLRGDDITHGQLVDQALDYSSVFADVLNCQGGNGRIWGIQAVLVVQIQGHDKDTAATENVFTYFDFSKEIHRAITTSNAIESFNSKLKKEKKESSRTRRTMQRSSSQIYAKATTGHAE